MDMEKMIVVEKSTKWWLTVATGGALAVGLLSGYGLATAIHGTNSQQSAIQQPAFDLFLWQSVTNHLANFAKGASI